VICVPQRLPAEYGFRIPVLRRRLLLRDSDSTEAWKSMILTDIQQLLPVVNSKPDAELLSNLDSTVAWPSRKVATPAGSASSDSPAADARSGNMPPTPAP
jgi:hypothetical protein